MISNDNGNILLIIISERERERELDSLATIARLYTFINMSPDNELAMG